MVDAAWKYRGEANMTFFSRTLNLSMDIKKNISIQFKKMIKADLDIVIQKQFTVH